MIETGYGNNNFMKDLTIDYNYSNELKTILSNNYATIFRLIVNFSVETSRMTIHRVT